MPKRPFRDDDDGPPFGGGGPPPPFPYKRRRPPFQSSFAAEHRRPETEGQWWSVTEAEWERMAPAMRTNWSHVGRIMETPDGEAADAPCAPCVDAGAGRDCYVYTPDAKSRYNFRTTVCARCRAKAHVCSLNPNFRNVVGLKDHRPNPPPRFRDEQEERMMERESRFHGPVGGGGGGGGGGGYRSPSPFDSRFERRRSLEPYDHPPFEPRRTVSGTPLEYRIDRSARSPEPYDSRYERRRSPPPPHPPPLEYRMEGRRSPPPLDLRIERRSPPAPPSDFRRPRSLSAGPRDMGMRIRHRSPTSQHVRDYYHRPPEMPYDVAPPDVHHDEPRDVPHHNAVRPGGPTLESLAARLAALEDQMEALRKDNMSLADENKFLRWRVGELEESPPQQPQPPATTAPSAIITASSTAGQRAPTTATASDNKEDDPASAVETLVMEESIASRERERTLDDLDGPKPQPLQLELEAVRQESRELETRVQALEKEQAATEQIFREMYYAYDALGD